MANDPESALDPAATEMTGEVARDGAKKRRDPNQPAAVVGLGASAGGIGPLQQFFTDMAPDSGLAFVVVMHLSPEHESQLANVIQQKTAMPVTQVSGTERVRPNHVYVIPPNHQLTFNDSTLQLVEPQRQLGRRVTIDLFFRTLAHAYGQRAVGVILSGSDSDGVIGLKHIRAQGGLTIVQDPAEAEHETMPVSAISTGMVDWVLPVEKMPAKLLEFVHNENRMKLPPEIEDAAEPDVKVEDAPGGETVSDETRAPADEEAIGRVLANVRAQTGHDFTHYKRATILRRIARRMQVNSIETIPQYVDFIHTHPIETRALLQDLLIGVTHFFRDHDAFAALEAHIAQLFAGKARDDEVRVWVAGCATGEEAYSIAMLLCEHAERLDDPPRIIVFATDIDEHAIADARDGLYPSIIEADVSPERLRQFFTREQGYYRVRKDVREKVLFAAHNVLKDAPFSRCDLISCRNLLIYLTAKAQAQVFDIFHFALRAGGLLFIGGSENKSAATSLFTPMDEKNRLFVRRSTPRPIWRMPILPMGEPSTGLRRGRTVRPLPALSASGAERATGDALDEVRASHTRREVLFGELHLRLLEQYGPPSAVVNEAHDIIHLSENVGRYLHFIPGEPTANITKVVDPKLQIELRTALFRASQSKEVVKGSPQKIDIDGDAETIAIEVRPMRTGDQAQGFFLILFHKEDGAAVEAPPPIPREDLRADANAEIQFLKEQLNATVEQYEATNEELKASNEELHAMNEEMRSATEELETSKEELQSVNEELTTVNHELKSTVEELSRANADLNSLMAASDIGTLFLDRQLRIQRFTPSAQEVFNLIDTDLGRPIADITHKLENEDLIAACDQVLDRLIPIEREVASTDKRWWALRIIPYRTTEQTISGVVLTLIDITARKNAEDEVRKIQTRLQRIFETEAVGVLLFDHDGRVIDANEVFLKMTGYKRAEIQARELTWMRMTPPEWRADSEKEWAKVAATGRIGPYEKEYFLADGTKRWMLFAGRDLGDGTLSEYVIDITARKEMEDALRESEERLRTVADHIPQIIWTNEPNGEANYFNKRWYEFTGLNYEQSRGPGWQAVVHPEDAPASTKSWQRALAAGEVFDCEYRLRGADGKYRWFIGRNVPLKDRQGNVLSWFGSATDIDELKQAESKLRETRERFELLVEGAKDYAMFLLDLDNRITYWSAGAERVFGWPREEAEGKTGALIFTDEDKARGEVEKEIATAMQRGRAPDRRWHLRKDGSRFWVDGVMARLDDEHGQPRGLAKIARDATEQKQTDEELRYARDQLEQRVLERTADLVAINNELERTMADREQLERELLEISERERRRVGQDLHDIVCQELTATALFLKSTSNKIDNSEAAKTLSEAALIVNRNVGVARDLARNFQPAELRAGGLIEALRGLCKQTNEHPKIHCALKLPKSIRLQDETIALNLFRIAQEAVRNSVSHSGGDEIIICIERERAFIRLVIEDNGKGFRQRKSKRGKGLGVHIMKYRANVLGGTLMIDPRPKGGTKVTCEVPIKTKRRKKK